MIQIEATPLARVGASLGEGPVWVEHDAVDSGVLWFVDIDGQRVHRFDSVTGNLDAWNAPEKVAWVLPMRDGQFLAGLASGIYLFSPEDGSFALRHAVELDMANNRLNDAAVDQAGRIWLGTMNTAGFEPTSSLYAYHLGDVRVSDAEPAAILNGPAISPDGKTIYVVDTIGAKVDAYSIDRDGKLGERRHFLTVNPSNGFPEPGPGPSARSSTFSSAHAGRRGLKHNGR